MEHLDGPSRAIESILLNHNESDLQNKSFNDTTELGGDHILSALLVTFTCVLIFAFTHLNHYITLLVIVLQKSVINIWFIKN